MQTIELNGVQCETFWEAIEEATDYGRAIQLRDGRIFAVTEDSMDDLLAANAVAAMIDFHEKSGRIMTVPID